MPAAAGTGLGRNALMADPARSAVSPAAPGWRDVRLAVMKALEICDGSAGDACTLALRDLAAQLRGLAFDEDLIEQEAARRAEEIMAARGLVPPPRGRHLRAV
jgi:hypothetical protein